MSSAVRRATPNDASGNFTAELLPIGGLILVRPRRFADHRGAFVETYSRRDYIALGIDADFVQDNQSVSIAEGTIRGMHFQSAPRAQAKLVRVLRGAILDVVVDLRRSSATFGRHEAVRLDAEGGDQLYVPAGFAHGFCTLEPDTHVAYKVSDYFSPEHDRGLAWDDPALGLPWPVAAADAVLSDKDRRHPALSDIPDTFN